MFTRVENSKSRKPSSISGDLTFCVKREEVDSNSHTDMTSLQSDFTQPQGWVSIEGAWEFPLGCCCRTISLSRKAGSQLKGGVLHCENRSSRHFTQPQGWVSIEG
jgi:hypothetical protein